MSEGSRSQKIALIVKEAAAQIIETESNKTALITVTNCTVSDDFKTAMLYISVLPEEGSDSALNFVKRKRREIRDSVKKRLAMNRIPFIDVIIDAGEQNRQKIDQLLREG